MKEAQVKICQGVKPGTLRWQYYQRCFQVSVSQCSFSEKFLVVKPSKLRIRLEIEKDSGE